MLLCQKKKKVGSLYGRPLVEGDPNYVKDREILVKKENKFVTLAERKKGGLQTLSKACSTVENFGLIYSFQIDEDAGFPSSKLQTGIICNPDTLEELFKFLPYIRYNPKTNEAEPFLFSRYYVDSYIPYTQFREKSGSHWKDKEYCQEILQDLVTLKLRPMENPIFTHFLCHPYIGTTWACFKNGVLQGIWDTSNIYLEPFEVSSIFFRGCASCNCNGEKVEDTIEIASSMPDSTLKDVDNKPATDETCLVCYGVPLILSPMVNGAFTIGKLSGTSTFVLVI